MAVHSSAAGSTPSTEYKQALLGEFAKLPEYQQVAFLEKATVELKGNTPAIMAAMEALLKIDGRETSASTEVAQAQEIAKQVAAKGQNSSAAVATGAQLGASAAVVNLAANEVQANQAQQAEIAGTMHATTVAKVEGREAPPANEFAAALANSGYTASQLIPESMRQSHGPVASIVGSGQQRSSESGRNA